MWQVYHALITLILSNIICQLASTAQKRITNYKARMRIFMPSADYFDAGVFLHLSFFDCIPNLSIKLTQEIFNAQS